MQHRHKLYLLITCLLPMTVATSSAHADDIVLDAFTDLMDPKTSPNGNPYQGLWTGTWYTEGSGFTVQHIDDDPQSDLAGVYGGARYSLMTASDDDPLNFIDIYNGTLRVATAIGGSGFFELEYGPFSTHLDISNCSALSFTLDGDLDDGGVPRPVDLTILVGDGAAQSQQIMPQLLNDGVYDIPLSQFTNVDRTDVEVISLIFDASAVSAVDYVVGALRFTGCPTAVPGDNDDQDQALVLTDLSASYSGGPAYDTAGATPDGAVPSCYTSGPSANRWFRFQAVTDYIDVHMFADPTLGTTLQYPVLALWDQNGNEVDCVTFSAQYAELSIQRNDLVPGQWYYISADNFHNAMWQGTFALSINDQEPVSNDYKANAILLASTGTYSGGAAYSSLGATPDDVKGSCWNNGPNFNRWFKFQAQTSTANISVQTGGAQGTMQWAFAALWDASGTQKACAKSTPGDPYSGVTITKSNLVPGQWYYLAVDNFENHDYQGSFTLSVTGL